MKTKRWRVILAVVAVFVLGATLFGFWFHAHGARAVATYQRQLVAAGEKLTVDELLPPPVPPAENGVTVFRQATASWRTASGVLATNPPLPMRMVKAGKAQVGWAQPVVRGDSSGGGSESTNSWEDVEAAIALNEPAFELLGQLIDHPSLDFQLDYRGGFAAIAFVHLTELKRATQTLTAATLCDLHRGDCNSAARRIRTSLALLKGDSNERIIISQLVRIARAHIAAPATWEFLQAPGINEAQLATLQHDWSELEFLHSAEGSLAMERVMFQQMFDSMRQSSAVFRQQITVFGPAAASGSWFQRFSSAAVLKTKESLWRAALSYPDQLRGLKGQQALIEGIRKAEREHCFAGAFEQQNQQLTGLGLTPRNEDSESWLAKLDELDFASFSKTAVLSLERFIHRVYSAEATRQIVVAAIALKRFQLRHGALPASLAELVPDLVPEVPRDPMDGQPLRYRLKEDGSFLLYSIGDDGHDDGGDASSTQNYLSFTWQRGRDLVWPQPATAEEVQKYFESKKK
jgi:hypothetical protein